MTKIEAKYFKEMLEETKEFIISSYSDMNIITEENPDNYDNKYAAASGAGKGSLKLTLTKVKTLIEMFDEWEGGSHEAE